MEATIKREAPAKAKISLDEKAREQFAPSLLRNGTTLDLTIREEQRIRELAFQFYQERGRADGHDLDDWLQAEAILRGRKFTA